MNKKDHQKNTFFPLFFLFLITVWIEYSLIHIYPEQQFQQVLRSQQDETKLKFIQERKEQEEGDKFIKNHDYQQYSEHFHYPNARRYLQELTNFGPRVTGSRITEEKIPEWIVKTIKQIEKEHKNPEMKIEIDIQRPSSNFHLDFLGGIHNIYNNVTNVIVRLTWPNHMDSHKNNGVLINAHFDSIPSSLGAADDGIGVAVMFEMIRALSYGKPLQFPLFLLFNGAEEWNHQAAHGFISQHGWASQIKYLMNLEATGTGGREMVFQCNSGQLAAIYGDNVPFPQASVMAHELFKAFLYQVASTDWATLIKFAPNDIQGIDTAYVDNGYVYHTTFDNENIVPNSTLYNTGENILHLTRALGDASVLDRYGGLGTRDKKNDESAVFYDLFFFKLLVYSGWTVFFLHSAVVLFGVWTISFLMKQSNGRITAKVLWYGVKDELTAQGSIIGVALLYGLLAHLFFPMRWYDGGMRIGILEFFPFVLFITFVFRSYFVVQRGAVYTNPILRQLSCLTMWVGISALMTVTSIMTGFIAVLWVLFLSVACLVYWYLKKLSIQYYLVEHEKDKGKGEKDKELLDFCTSKFVSLWNPAGSSSSPVLSYLFSAECWYLLILAPKLLLTHRYYDATMTMLIPLFGKTGSALPTDIAMASTIATFVSGVSGPLLANDLKTKLSKRFVTFSSISVILLWVYVIFTTSAYSADRPKRLWIQHVTREYRNIPEKERVSYFNQLLPSSGKQLKGPAGAGNAKDYGLWVIAFDSQGFHPIDSYILSYYQEHGGNGQGEGNGHGKVHDYHNAYQKVQCDSGNGQCYTQFPWYFPVAENLRDSYYLPTEQPPLLSEEESFQLLVSSHDLPKDQSHGQGKRNTRLIEIVLVGPSHMHLVLRTSPPSQVPLKERLVRWYLNETLPSSLSTVQQTLSRYSEKEKPVYSEKEVAGLVSKLQGSVSAMRWDNIYFFEVGSGLCPSSVCMKKVYVEVEGDEPIDVMGYGHFVEKARIDGKRAADKHQQQQSSSDPIDQFLEHLPDWSKGAEWTKFPSSLIVERI